MKELKADVITKAGCGKKDTRGLVLCLIELKKSMG